jgi:hypothetical protein
MNIGMQNKPINTHPIPAQNYNQAQSIEKNVNSEDQQDTVSISPLGKTQNLIESLIKHKQNIIDSKNSLVGRTLEKGENIDSIKPQLEAIEEQLKIIDEQISQIMTERIKQQNDDEKKTNYKKPKTEEELQTEHLNSVVRLSVGLDKTKVITSVKTKTDSEANILETEIKLDESRGGASEMKKERLADLKKQSANLSNQISESLNEVDEEINSKNEKSKKEQEL